jgi:class 3 adenylate cyclase
MSPSGDNTVMFCDLVGSTAMSTRLDPEDFGDLIRAFQGSVGTLVLEVGLRATKPGKHPINGLFRVGYIHGTDELAMVSPP